MAHESELLQGVDHFGVSQFEGVQILEEPEFIDRYAGVVGLRGTVSVGRFHTASDRWPVEIMSVSPFSLEKQIETAKRFWESGDYDPAEAEAFTRRYYASAKGPMPPDEVEQVADRIRTTLEKQMRYDRMGRLQRVAQNLRFLTGRESCVVSIRDEIRARLPDVITIKDDQSVLSEVIVAQEAEDTYRSLPPNNWRSGGQRVVPIKQ